MKNDFLLPPLYKKVGLAMLLPFVGLGLYVMCGGEFSFANVTFFALVENEEWFRLVENNFTDEIAMLGLLLSLVFVALSRERDEDEMTAFIRMRSFILSAWISAPLLAIGILFIYFVEFLQFMCMAIYFYLIIYIVVFNLAMCRERKDQR